jgi:protein-disulfide isomerase
MSVTLTLCAVAIVGMYARREFFSPPGASSQNSASAAPVFLPSWNQAADVSVRMGPSTAPVSIMILSDFECPACRGFANTVREARRANPEDIQVLYVHYPIAYHRFAVPAARAAECAGAHGRFEAMHDQLFAKQDSLGLKAWGSYATDAEVPDLVEFESCASERAPIPRLEAGKAFGEEINVLGTPTVIINGWRMSRVPNLKQLEQYTASIREGKPLASQPN